MNSAICWLQGDYLDNLQDHSIQLLMFCPEKVRFTDFPFQPFKTLESIIKWSVYSSVYQSPFSDRICCRKRTAARSASRRCAATRRKANFSNWLKKNNISAKRDT